MSFTISKKELEKAWNILAWGSKDYEEFEKAKETAKKFVENMPDMLDLKMNRVNLTQIINVFYKEFDFYNKNIFKIHYFKEEDYIYIKDNRKIFEVRISIKRNRIENICLYNKSYNPKWLMRLYVNDTYIVLDKWFGNSQINLKK